MSSPIAVDLQEIYSFALRLGKDAGKLLDEGWRSRAKGTVKLDHAEKESAVDLVTQTDEGQSIRSVFTATLRYPSQGGYHFTLPCNHPKSGDFFAD